MAAEWSRDALDRIGAAGGPSDHHETTRRHVAGLVADLGGVRRPARVCADLAATWRWLVRSRGGVAKCPDPSPGLEVDASIQDVGDHDAELRTGIDLAYRVKYGRGTAVDQMITDDAAASTLRIVPNQ